jgi:flagellar motor protein MotB
LFRRRQIPKKSGEGENPFLLTFSDFMASLLAIFILVLIVTLIELERKKDDLRRQEIEIAAAKESLKRKENEISVAKDDLLKSLESIQTVQDTIASSLQGVSYRERALAGMLEGIQKELKQSGIEVVLAENGTVLRIPEQQLQFALGKYEIPLAHTGPATTIGKALLEALSKPENQTLLDTVFVEGHTDSVPNSREMGNWGLSTYRAISLWNFWTDKPGGLFELKALRTAPADPKIAAKPLISVSGYADTRSTHGLLDGQALKDDRSEDRRIDIRFTLVSSEKQSLEGLRENMKQMRDKTDVLIKKLKSSSHDP